MRKPGYVPNTAQMKLAEEVTRFAHGEEERFSIVDVSVSSGLFESKSAARRLLKQGGVYMNNERVDDENKRVEEGT
ncbi:hypothetical protein F2Q68_00033331 [Brassica cretica]|uniref:RNA-binding S4 domain-containing protein n=2 Tax=Brassica cretica TaxID=69181 RepID=A0A8S9G9A9_BRACR|nr:hypothetical protein F2Q68_00033331 [Brassica cretica]KAF3528973.1 hypothetical protein DY000_02044093 [Brassica cretica]